MDFTQILLHGIKLTLLLYCAVIATRTWRNVRKIKQIAEQTPIEQAVEATQLPPEDQTIRDLLHR